MKLKQLDSVVIIFSFSFIFLRLHNCFKIIIVTLLGPSFSPNFEKKNVINIKISDRITKIRLTEI